MRVTLYWMEISHPSRAAREMLDFKGAEYTAVAVFPFNQRVHLRLAGFRGGTVPALRVDGRRIQGSRRISRALDELYPDPPLFPADPELRARVVEAEEWGEERLQPIPRRLARFGVVHDPELRRWAVQRQGLPAALAHLVAPVAAYYCRAGELDGRRADEPGIRTDLAALPALLERADALLAQGTIATDPPNAATFQVLSSVRVLQAFDDLRELVTGPAAAAAREVFPDYPVRVPKFLPPDWLPAPRAPATAG